MRMAVPCHCYVKTSNIDRKWQGFRKGSCRGFIIPVDRTLLFLMRDLSSIVGVESKPGVFDFEIDKKRFYSHLIDEGFPSYPRHFCIAKN